MPTSSKTIVKVKAFPIPAALTFGTEPVVRGQILKLTAAGFLVEAHIPGLKTGEKFQVAFELPVLHKEISEACVVVKLYTMKGSHMIEGHFQAPSTENESQIMRFTASIPKA